MNIYKLAELFQMNRILNFVSILGLFSFCLALWWDNHTSGLAPSPEVVAVLLIGTIFIYARRGILSSILKIVIAVFGLGYSLMKIALISNQQFIQIASFTGTLLIMLFGIYVMFGGMRKDKDEIHFSINPKTGKLKRRW